MPRSAKLTPIDWVVMIGGPLAFLLIAYFWLTALLGPPVPPNPIGKLRAGVVRMGMTAEQVERTIGPPREITTRADGGFTYRYYRGTAEPFVEDEAYVEFGGSGVVTGLSFERTAVRPPGYTVTPEGAVPTPGP
jgi:hypothetical protein